MTSLATLQLAPSYRSGRDSLLKDFYLPALDASVRYDRAVGFFSGSLMAYLGHGLDGFAERGGTMRLVASPVLSPEDLDQIHRGYAARDVIAASALRALKEAADDPDLRPGLGRLGRLVADGRLDVKLAFVNRDSAPGIYHEKVGILRDREGASIVFKGSANETLYAMEHNFESIDVFRSWVPYEDERVAQATGDFNALWANDTPLLEIVEFTKVTREVLEDLARSEVNTPLPQVRELPTRTTQNAETLVEGKLTIPPGLVVRDYQKSAVRRWLSKDGRGILRMATGTGKTLTALAGAAQLGAQLRKRGQDQLLTIIVVPFQHLVDQWTRDVQRFGVHGIAAYESQDSWRPQAGALIDALLLGSVDHGVIVTTNRTLQLPVMQSVMSRAADRIPTLIIGDEVHNLGAKSLRDSLPEGARFRLGLSATPERWFDDEGTDAIHAYFGEVVYELGLGDAIEIGALVPYDYYPILVELDPAEADLYDEITDKISKAFAMKDLVDDPDDEHLTLLLRQRSNVLAHASGKLSALRTELSSRAERHHQLIYCAEGSRPTGLGEPTENSQVDQVLDLVGNQMGLTADIYVSDTPRAARVELLRRFSDARDLQLLISMRCLDEGVDIPDARTAYLLASSTNPKQFIQRRGRVLRRAEGKTHADIVDFVVVPPSGSGSARNEVDRRLISRELGRVVEFARLSRNEGHSLAVLRPVREEYSLMDI